MWLAFDLLTRVVIGGSLSLAGLTKLTSTVGWRQLWLACHRLLPRRLVAPVAMALPVAELGCGLAVLMGVLGAASALAGAAALAGLAAGVAVALIREPEISRSSLGLTGEVLSWPGVTRNLLLAAAAAVAGWHGGAEFLGATAISWTGQSACLAAAVAALYAVALALRASRRRRTLASIERRLAGAGPGQPG
jgi:Methylamine utilisation protein MauE